MRYNFYLMFEVGNYVWKNVLFWVSIQTCPNERIQK